MFFECIPYIYVHCDHNTNQYGIKMNNVVNVTLREQVKDLCKQLRKIDSNLSRLLKKLPESEGHVLLNQTKMYNVNIKILLNYISQYKNETMELSKYILNKGGPDFLDVDLDDEQIKNSFKWTDKELNIMYDSRIVTYQIWNGILNETDGWKAIYEL